MTTRLTQGKRFDAVRFPAMCAHRGLSGLMPESCLPGFAAGIVLGADEIEFDIRVTKDKHLIVSHDNKVDRIADGTGSIPEMTFEQLRALRLRSPEQTRAWDVTFSTPEEVFAAIGSACVMNLHFKNLGEDTEDAVREVHRLVKHYGLEHSVYFSASEEETMRLFVQLAPEIPRCALEPWREDLDIVDFAVAYGCKRCQLFKGCFDAQTVRRAIDASVVCNVFWADDEDAAREYLDMGISVLLTNRADRIAAVIEEYRGK